MYKPLADKIRPITFDDVVGQEHILGEGSVLRRVTSTGDIPNMIFYGPSGVGKTTVANIIAQQSNRKLVRLNATTASLSDIREITSETGTLLAPKGVLLYLDEIQYFNKKQQQSLLEFIENGSVTLIASTTENPYFYVYNAILSRSTVFEFRPISPADTKIAVARGFLLCSDEKIKPSDELCEFIAQSCGGDIRKALNAVELLCVSAKDSEISLDDAEVICGKSAMRYDKDGDMHYDVLSAFQKSIRGSDPDAAIHYLARILSGGDMISACRRLLVIASEDIGLAYPQAAAIVNACVDSAHRLGMPEARIPLAEATILLATAPKSNSAIMAIDMAMADIEAGKNFDIPAHLKDAHYGGASKLGRGITYKYPHSYENSYVKQQYLPTEIANIKYYNYGNNKTEQLAKKYWDNIIENK